MIIISLYYTILYSLLKVVLVVVRLQNLVAVGAHAKKDHRSCADGATCWDLVDLQGEKGPW